MAHTRQMYLGGKADYKVSLQQLSETMAAASEHLEGSSDSLKAEAIILEKLLLVASDAFAFSQILGTFTTIHKFFISSNMNKIVKQ